MEGATEGVARGGQGEDGYRKKMKKKQKTPRLNPKRRGKRQTEPKEKSRYHGGMEEENWYQDSRRIWDYKNTCQRTPTYSAMGRLWLRRRRKK